MNAIQNMLDTYGRSMGVGGMAQDVSALYFKTGEQITLDHRDDRLVVSLSYELPEYEVDDVIEKLLHLTHFQACPDYQVQPGMLGQRLVMSISITPGEASIDYLDGAIRRLRQRHQELIGTRDRA